MPPTHNAAVACAVMRRGRPFPIELRSKTPTMAWNTVSNARFALSLLRDTSEGSATIGHVRIPGQADHDSGLIPITVPK